MNRQNYSHGGAAELGIDLHETTQRPDALPHPGDSDARHSRALVHPFQNFGGYAAAVVCNLESKLAALPPKTNFSRAGARVAVNVRDGFLRDSEQGSFYLGGEPARPGGKDDADLCPHPPIMIRGEGSERGLQSLLFQQGRLNQVGQIGKIAAAFTNLN